MEQLDVGIVPYIVLLVVPVLGRMSDQTDSVRFMATQCFATLIRLMPLEVSRRHLVYGLTGYIKFFKMLNVFVISIRKFILQWVTILNKSFK